jgi:hypothetical protein
VRDIYAVKIFHTVKPKYNDIDRSVHPRQDVGFVVSRKLAE